MAIYMWREEWLPIPTNWLLAYRPLETDNKDLSGNNYDVTITGCSFGTIGDKSWIRVSSSYTQSPTDYIATPNIWNLTTFSFAWWLYKTNSDTSWSKDWTSFFENATADTANAIRLRCKYKITRSVVNWSSNTDAQGYTLAQNTWVHYCITSDWTTAKVYVNWQYFNSFSAGTNNSDSSWVFYIGYGIAYYSSDKRCRPWWVRHFAFYNRVLTDQEASDIYTATA
jgi:hypothetical protein